MACPKNTTTQHYLGTHIIAEFFGCDHLNNLPIVKKALIDAAHVCGATILGTHFHTFDPQGLTGYVLLAESHISVHTWPEFGYAAVDVYTCGLMQTHKAVEHLQKVFNAEHVDSQKIMRGNTNNLPINTTFRYAPHTATIKKNIPSQI
ncbi:MAG: adenosylmethionine decarboxylase [bacterium]